MSVRPFHCARKDERPPGLAADGGVDRQRGAHVHGVADRVADDGVRPVHAPAIAVALGGGEHLVLLRVVEILEVEPRLLLAERCRRQLAFAIGLERTEIVLQPSDQRDMLDRAPPRERIEHVAHHGAVDADVLRLGRLPQPSRQEHMRRLRVLQRGTQARGIEQVCFDRPEPIDVGRRAACEPEHLPAPLAKASGQIVADYAAGTDDQRGICHDGLPSPGRGPEIGRCTPAVTPLQADVTAY
jgi:hypothetical protein